MRPRVQGCRYITAPSMASVNQAGWRGEEVGEVRSGERSSGEGEELRNCLFTAEWISE